MSLNQGGRGRGRPPLNKLAGCKRANNTNKSNNATGNGTNMANAGGTTPSPLPNQSGNSASNMANWLNPKNSNVGLECPKYNMEIDENVKTARSVKRVSKRSN